MKSGASEYLRQIVAELAMSDSGVASVDYDINGNSSLDMDSDVEGYGSEWGEVIKALGAVQDDLLNVIHVKDIRRKKDGVWNSVAGFKLKGDKYVIISDSSDIVTLLCHEVLHTRGLLDVGPAGQNTLNLMYYIESKLELFLGYFKVEKSNTPSQYQNQWNALIRE